jgi:hypothetical protein
MFALYRSVGSSMTKPETTIMSVPYQARRISKTRADAIKRTGALQGAILLDTFEGFIIVEPAGAGLGDGETFSPQEADYELQPVWHLGPKATLREARKRLGLENPSRLEMAGSGA